jgi:hypothetical protein
MWLCHQLASHRNHLRLIRRRSCPIARRITIVAYLTYAVILGQVIGCLASRNQPSRDYKHKTRPRHRAGCGPHLQVYTCQKASGKKHAVHLPIRCSQYAVLVLAPAAMFNPPGSLGRRKTPLPMILPSPRPPKRRRRKSENGGGMSSSAVSLRPSQAPTPFRVLFVERKEKKIMRISGLPLCGRRRKYGSERCAGQPDQGRAMMGAMVA